MRNGFLLKRIIPFLMALSITLTSMCQNASIFGFDTRRINVKTPNAAALDAFSKVGVNFATGVPNISIPVYELVLDGELSLPIGLRYHASGFKFGELPSVVGYKWALDAGGMISRDINGMPDENYYFQNYNDIPTIVETMRNDGVSYDETTPGQYYLKNFSNNRIDINQDYYSLNYFNGSANLVYKNGKFYAESDTYKYKIEGFNEFTVTDDKGYKYIFGGEATDDVYYEKSDPSHSSSPGSSDPDFAQGTISRTSWMLRKVISPYGKEINFEYVRYNLGYVPSNISETYKKGFITSSSNGTPCGCPSPTLTIITNGGTYQTSLVSRIYSDDTEVLFTYSDNSGLAYWKKQLDDITIRHRPTNTVIKKVALEYGSFDNQYLKLTKVNEVNVNNAADKKTYDLEYHTNLTLPAMGSYSRDIFGYYNGATNARLISTNNNIYTQTYQSANRTPNLSYAQQTMLSAITYPTGGKASFTYELNQVGNRYAPGIRIKEINRYTSGSDLADRTVYEYSGLFGGINSPFTIPFDFSDTYNCTIYTFKSDYPLNDRIARNFYYSTVKVRQIGATTELAETYNYEALINRQGLFVPYLKSETKYLGATTQKVSETINNYQTEEIDSLTTANTISVGSVTAYRGVGPGVYCYTYYMGIQEMTPSPGYNLLLKSTENKLYNNTEFIVTKDTFFYQSPYHRYLTESQRFNSKGGPIVQRMKYVQDYTSITSPAIPSGDHYIYEAMIARNIKHVVLEQEDINNSILVQKQKNHFQLPGDNLIHPAKQTAVYRDGSSKDVNLFTKFSLDKLLEFKDASDINNALIWDYSAQHLIASVTNATTDKVAYTSFEADGLGGWTLNPGSVILYNYPGITGRNTVSGGVQKIVPAGNYTVSFWSIANSWLNGQLVTYTPVKIVGPWRYYQITLNNISSINIAGDNIDDIRLYPQGAQMTTYTYDPLVGITSQSDVNNRITYYEYDGFGRLKLTRDENKNVLKTFDYQFRKNYNQ